MTKPSIILIGAGGHAHACIDVIEQNGCYEIAGLVGMPDELGKTHLTYKVIATDTEISALANQYQCALIAIGQIQSPDKRIDFYNKAKGLGFKLPSIISPGAYVSRHAKIGNGTIVMHGVVINAGAEIGSNCIINTHSLIEHDSIVGNHCHVSTGAILNGNVSVGEGSFIGSNSVIKEGVSIGPRSLVGMGLSIRNNQEAQIRVDVGHNYD